MRERSIWKIVLWTVTGLALLFIVMQADGGFLTVFPGDAVIPVPLGDEIQIVATRSTPLSGGTRTTLYRLKPGGSVEELKSFADAPQCVTGVEGRVFITFEDGSSSIFEEGRWLRSVAAPTGLKVMDVAAAGSKVYGFGLLGDEQRIGVRLYEGAGWSEPGPPLDAGEPVFFRGCIDVSGGVAVFFGTNKGAIKHLDFGNMRWRYAIFDGHIWGDAVDVKVPEEVMPNISALDGELIFVFTSTEKRGPVTIAALADGEPKTLAEMSTEGLGRVLDGWLVSAGGKRHLILTGAAAAWDVPLEGMQPGEASKILAISGASRARSSIYVGLAAVAAVMLVSLGVAWFMMRLKRVRGGEEG